MYLIGLRNRGTVTLVSLPYTTLDRRDTQYITNQRLIEPIMGSRARPVASALCRLDSKSNGCAQTSRPRTHACNRA